MHFEQKLLILIFISKACNIKVNLLYQKTDKTDEEKS